MSSDLKSDLIFNPQTYTQSYSHHGTRGMGVNGTPSLEFLICCSISKRFYRQWKAFVLFYKMRYILWVVALLEACDVTKHGRHIGHHLGSYKELENSTRHVK